MKSWRYVVDTGKDIEPIGLLMLSAGMNQELRKLGYDFNYGPNTFQAKKDGPILVLEIYDEEKAPPKYVFDDLVLKAGATPFKSQTE